MKKIAMPKRLFCLALITAFIAAFSALVGCGGTTTVTVIETAPSTTASPIQAYKDEIDKLATRADAINIEYRGLIDKNEAGQISDADMAVKAKQNFQAYEDMATTLTTMKVPPEFQEAQKLFISGFYKWQSVFDSYEIGFRTNDAASFQKAGNLDDQAVIEVNQALNMVKQVESQ